MRSLGLTIAIISCMLVQACNGVLSGIYDDPVSKDWELGFSQNPQRGTRVVAVDSRDYSKWTYIDFERETVTTLGVEEEVPLTWDIAIHRYDAKTNGAKVAVSQTDDILNPLAGGTVVVDSLTDDKIAVDMSGMLSGNIVYCKSFYNPLLSQWLDVDISVMPPIYTLSHKVYILTFPDGRHFSMRLENYMNDAAVKGYMTIEYVLSPKS